MARNRSDESSKIARRDFLCAAGMTGARAMLGPGFLSEAANASIPAFSKKGTPTVRAAFLYPPTDLLKKKGYYSWPGSGFDAEAHQKQYTEQIKAMYKTLGMQILLDEKPLYEPAQVAQFVNEVKTNKPDGLLLIPFKKSSWTDVKKIINETHIPTIAVATLGVLLMTHIQEIRHKAGVYPISALDDFDAIRYGLKMIRTAWRMKNSVILSVTDLKSEDMTVPHLGTKVKVVPMQRFVDVYKSTETSDEVKNLAHQYLTTAKERREPSDPEVLEAARAYVALKKLIFIEKVDVVMMQCLDGITKKQIPPPCMAYMTLRDQGVVAGCQNDLDATLTMMLVQQLFNKPAFQENPACDTENNLYFAAHCTCPSKMHGPTGPVQPYILRNHAEAGVGVVPQVLWPKEQEVTIVQYQYDETEMLIYSGKVVRCIDTPPAGGCRTNVVTTINEVDACDVQFKTAHRTMHHTMFVGDHVQQLKAYCQMYSIKTAV